jgi:preprotein translocase subunit SecY
MTAMVSLVAGTMFLMWLGEQITERGLGNGISIIIFAGIVAGLPSAIGGLFELVRTGAMSIIASLFIIALVVFVTFAVVFVERGQRKILVNYAKRQVGNKVYGGQSSHLPLKLNMSGVIPPIFASSIILLPATAVGWIATGSGEGWFTRFLKDSSALLQPGQPVYVMLYAAMIVFFCFFYTALVFNSRETAENLKKSGAFIPGIRPGKSTATYLDYVLTRITVIGALYITVVCVIPEWWIASTGLNMMFLGGTSLLIVVNVTVDTITQIQSHLLAHQYGDLIKKAKLKGRIR